MLKPGDSATYEVNGDKLILKPLPYGRLKKVMAEIAKVFEKVIEKTGTGNTVEFIQILPDLVGQHVTTLFPLLFDPKEHPFLNAEWVDENLTVPMAKQIMDDAIKVNGLDDFFRPKTQAPAPPPQNENPPRETRDLSELTPSANPGPTISVALPTVGLLAKSTS